MAKDPKRSAAGRMGAYARIAQGKDDTSAARAALEKKFEDEVDPDRVLSEAERAKRVKAAKSLHYMRLSRRRWAK